MNKIIHRKETGVALYVVLIMILITSMLGISAMQASIFETRVAANHQHKNLAFQAAENALMRALGTENLNDVIPASTTPGAAKASSNFFSASHVTGQPATSANLTATYIEKATQDISGYQVDSDILVYELEAEGRVDGTSSRAINKMGIGYIIPNQ
ncbi:hypothetical protein BOW50_06915 [Solemya velum gill symbiont]|uniref:pilus assembly PilX family protein n=1 Tax=Solemya velum gill symbiont TaxID=2340 RepID=UPI0009962351|nr:PilX N-terminal domain-containing pilus assembly protein [Solemya velum gill symbiont]OOZ77988.1 hypothetical protein BOW50_06915 [Solemya velum gill symbiont]